MRRLIRTSVVLSTVAVAACGGGGGVPFSTLVHPTELRASSVDLPYDNRTARLIYVCNRLGGTVSLLDQVKERLIDSNETDDFDVTPITVGGELSAIAVQDLAAGPRLFAADATHGEIFAFDAVVNSDPARKDVRHTPVDFPGADPVVRTSEALFKNDGRSSNPVLRVASVDAAAAAQQWEVRFINESSGFRVTGSVSGEQTGRAIEGKAYQTDDKTVSFTVTAGGDATTGGDTFRFGVLAARPLNLANVLGGTPVPVDLQIDTDQGRLLVVTRSPARVVVVDLESLSILTTVTLSDGSAVDAVPGRTALGSGHLYVPNRSAPNAFDVDLNTLTASVLDTGTKAEAASLDGSTATLYLSVNEAREVRLYDLAAPGGVPDPIGLDDFAYGLYPFSSGGKALALVPTLSGSIDVVDVTDRTRVDTNVTSGDRQSTETQKEFFDTGPKSSPRLVSVKTADGVTLTERWQLTYETSGSYIVVGSISGAQKNRVVEGTSYTSDTGAISLTIRPPSRTEPTTAGDVFTFDTFDGVDPVYVPGRHLSRSAVIVVRPGETDPVAYVAHEESAAISSINLITFRVRKSIH